MGGDLRVQHGTQECWVAVCVEEVERAIPEQSLVLCAKSTDRFRDRLEPAGTIMNDDRPRK